MKTSRRALLLGTAAVAVGGAEAWWLLREPSGPDLSVGDFGAVGDGVVDDGPALRRALASAEARGPGATVRLGGRRYRVGGEPGADYALPVSGACGLSLLGEGATLVVNDPALGCLSLNDCDGCRVEGVTIDYDPPPFAQTTVIALNPIRGTFDVEMTAGYPSLNSPFFRYPAPGEPHPGTFGAVFDPTTRLLRAGVVDYVFVTAAQLLGPQRFRLTARDGVPAGLVPGDIFVYLVRDHGAAVACYRSPRTQLTAVDVRAANAVAFALVQSEAVRLTRCHVGRGLDSERLVSTNADGVHAQGCRIGPTVEDCSFTAMLDDGLNIYAPPLGIASVPSDGEIVLTGETPVLTGDRLEFTDPDSGEVRGVRRVEKVLDTGSVVYVRLGSELPGLAAAAGTAFPLTAYNLSASGEGYLIRGNRYERHRGHAMRLHTGHGTVEGNFIRSTSREGIVVSNDPDWPEGPHTRDLVIRENTLEDTGGVAAIQVEGRKLGYQLADTITQRNIRIDDNTITDWRGSAVAVGAARKVRLRNNVLIVGADAEAFAAEQGILLEHVHGVEIDGLVVRTERPGELSAAIEVIRPDRGAKADVRIRRVKVPPGVAKVFESR